MRGYPPPAHLREIARAITLRQDATRAAAALQAVLLDWDAILRLGHLGPVRDEIPRSEYHLARAHREADWRRQLVVVAAFSLRKTQPVRLASTVAGPNTPAPFRKIRLNNLDDLKRGIYRTYSCRSHFIGSIHVREVVNAGLVWDGIVDVFDLVNCAAAGRCYAWTQGRKGRQSVCLTLRSFSVPSAAAAVRSFLEEP